MATRNIVPRADGEGQLGKAGKRWAEVNAAKINGSPTTATPTAGAIPISDGTGKIAAGWVPMSGESISRTDALALIIALS